MSRFTRLQKILIGCIAISVIMGFILKGISSSSYVETAGYDIVSMLRYTLFENPAKTIQNWMNDFSSLWSAKEENDKLRNELAMQPQLQSDLDEANHKVKEYEEMMELSSTLERYEKIYANVLVRDQELWNNTLTINKGKNENITENSAVMSSTGLIGIISSVGDNTSKVKLLTSQDRLNNVSIKIVMENGESEGVLEEYDVKTGNFIIRLFNNNDAVDKNMKVVTSGKGGVYPAGLLIGNVANVESLNNQIGKTVYVKPAANFSDFDTVMIVNEKKGE